MHLSIAPHALQHRSSRPRRTVSGRWLGDLELLGGLRNYEIHERHVTGVERDEMGVEYVRVYEVVKP